MLRRLHALRHTEGTLPALRLLVYRSVQRVMMLDVTRLLWLDRPAMRIPRADESCTFRFLNANEVEELAADPANELTGDLCNRIHSGRDFCFAALKDRLPAAYVWLALGSIEAEHNRGNAPNSGTALSYPAHTAFVYKGFTRAEFRGQKLYPACIAQAFVQLSPLGVEHLLISADWTNYAALRACRSLGFCDLGTLWRFGWGKASLTRSPVKARALGVRFGSQAQCSERELATSSRDGVFPLGTACNSRG